MPQPTYTPLATVTLTSNASSVTFSNIPATYRDLILVFNGSATSGSDLRFRFNSDTGNNYNFVNMGAASATPQSASSSNQSSIAVSYTAVLTTRRNVVLTQIMDYSATDKHKTLLARANDEGQGVSATAARWANTNAITTILLYPDANQFSSGSRFDLYGVIA